MKLRQRTLRFVKDRNKDVAESSGKKRRSPFLRRRASEVMNYRLFRKLVLICIAIGVAALMIGYSVVLIYDKTGRFSVLVDDPDVTYAITLSETPDFRSKSSRLTTDQQVAITNISGTELPPDIDSEERKNPAAKNETEQENGENAEQTAEKNYLEYTFYCKNLGKTETTLHYQLTFNNVTNHIDEAVRVRLYVKGPKDEVATKTDYAKEKPKDDNGNGGGKETVFCDEMFESEYVVCSGVVEGLAPEEYVRYTVVIWLEGNDLQCDDSVINGKIKFDMTIKARPTTDDSEEFDDTEEIDLLDGTEDDGQSAA